MDTYNVIFRVQEFHYVKDNFQYTKQTTLNVTL